MYSYSARRRLDKKLRNPKANRESPDFVEYITETMHVANFSEYRDENMFIKSKAFSGGASMKVPTVLFDGSDFNSYYIMPLKFFASEGDKHSKPNGLAYCLLGLEASHSYYKEWWAIKIILPIGALAALIAGPTYKDGNLPDWTKQIVGALDAKSFYCEFQNLNIRTIKSTDDRPELSDEYAYSIDIDQFGNTLAIYDTPNISTVRYIHAKHLRSLTAVFRRTPVDITKTYVEDYNVIPSNLCFSHISSELLLPTDLKLLADGKLAQELRIMRIETANKLHLLVNTDNFLQNTEVAASLLVLYKESVRIEPCHNDISLDLRLERTGEANSYRDYYSRLVKAAVQLSSNYEQQLQFIQSAVQRF